MSILESTINIIGAGLHLLTPDSSYTYRTELALATAPVEEYYIQANRDLDINSYRVLPEFRFAVRESKADSVLDHKTASASLFIQGGKLVMQGDEALHLTVGYLWRDARGMDFGWKLEGTTQEVAKTDKDGNIVGRSSLNTYGLTLVDYFYNNVLRREYIARRIEVVQTLRVNRVHFSNDSTYDSMTTAVRYPTKRSAVDLISKWGYGSDSQRGKGFFYLFMADFYAGVRINTDWDWIAERGPHGNLVGVDGQDSLYMPDYFLTMIGGGMAGVTLGYSWDVGPTSSLVLSAQVKAYLSGFEIIHPAPTLQDGGTSGYDSTDAPGFAHNYMTLSASVLKGFTANMDLSWHF